MRYVKINARTMSVVQDHLDKQKKIAAIKALRADAGCGLKEAKDAIERYSKENNYADYSNYDVSECPKIVVGPVIKRLVVDFGDGEIEVDLETMEMRALMELNRIGLDAAADILDLVQCLKGFAAGEGLGNYDESR